MGFWVNFKRRVKAVLAPLFFLSVAAFFGWNATQGSHGLVANTQEQALLRQVMADNTAARAERDAWVRRVSGLQAQHLDQDTLDERARAQLNLADPHDVVVQYGPKDKLF